MRTLTTRLTSPGVVCFFTLSLTFSAALIELQVTGKPIGVSAVLEIFFSGPLYLMCLVLFPGMLISIGRIHKKLDQNTQKLLQNRIFVNAILNAVQEMIIVFDKKGQLTIHNEQFQDFCFENNLSSQFANQLLNEEKIKDHLENSFRSPEEISLSIKGKVHHFIFSVSQPNLVDEGEFIIIGLQSINQIHSKREIIKEQQKRLERSSRLSALGEMAGGIAHEINNPLAVILGQALRSKKQIQELPIEHLRPLSRSLDKIIETVDRITVITQTLAKLSHSQKIEGPEKMTFQEIFKDINALLGPQFEENHIDLEIEENGLSKETFSLRRIEIEQILIDLLSNSIDAVKSLPHKKVTLKLEEKDDFIQIFIIDSGQGINQDNHEKIFEPMFTTKELGQGVGLGLSYCYGLAKDLGGELLFIKHAPQTTFVFKIPIVHDEKNKLMVS